MLNRNLGVFHPRFFYHARPTVESTMLAAVNIYRPTGEQSEWVPGVGMDDDAYELVWQGDARIQPNIDWRARDREFAGEFDATHAVRIQVPIGKNKLGAVYGNNGEIIEYGPDPEFYKDFVVRTMASYVKGTEKLVGMRYTVRNALNSSNAWVHNLLCDTGTKTGGE